ncbi:MAG TPA: ZIP family zinc transporter [Candidatus Limnocylindria bacterium]
MIEAFVWAFLAAAALLLGAGAALVMRVSKTLVGLMLAFGAGALISAVAFELTVDAFQNGGAQLLAAGLAAGAFTFFIGNRFLTTRGRRRTRLTVRPDAQRSGQGLSIVLGAMLDGIPESVVLGVSLLGGGTVSPAFFAAVLLSNVPEGFSASADLREEGRSPRWILGLWLAVVLASAVASALAWVVVDAAGPAVPFIQAFAAGGLLTMLVDTMIPEAFEDGGDLAGMVTVIGFAAAFLLSALT